VKDRVVEHPGRYQMVPVAGTTDTYDFVAVPGTVTEAGTDLSKGNLLTDATAALFGLGEDAVPDDALVNIRSLIDDLPTIETGTYTGTGTTTSTAPNSVVLSKPCKLMFIFPSGSGEVGTFPVFRYTEDYVQWAYYSAGTTQGYAKKSEDGKTISWYVTYQFTTIDQFNSSGVVYNYMAFVEA